MMEQMRRQFDMDSRIIEMRTHQQVLVRKGNLQAALQIGQTIEALFSKVVYEYLKEANDEAERIDIGTLNISKEDKAEINTLIVTLFMACDIIESATMDFNDVLKRVDDTLVMEQFDDIRNLSKSAKEKLRYLSQNSKLMKDLAWAYKCDDMYDMMKNKAKSILRKRASKDWGKNIEKFNDKK